MPRNNAEDRLQMAVIKHLQTAALPGVLWFSVPNEAARSPRTGARLKAMGLLPGAPDLVVLVDGRALGLELKAPAGRQTPEQRAVEIRWAAAGACYVCAKGIDAALDALVNWRALPEGYAYVPTPTRGAL